MRTPARSAGLLLVVHAIASAAPLGLQSTGERLILRIDPDSTDYCFYDGRPFSEGAYVDSPRGVLVCTYRERDAASGRAYLPGPRDRRLKWLPVDPPGEG